jgi:hypothetical protein
VNGLKPYGDMTALITVTERLRALQVINIVFSENGSSFNFRKMCKKYLRRHLVQQGWSIARHQTSLKQCITSLEELLVGHYVK